MKATNEATFIQWNYFYRAIDGVVVHDNVIATDKDTALEMARRDAAENGGELIGTVEADGEVLQ